MINLAKILVILLALTGIPEGGCPPGMIPYGGNNPNSCGRYYTGNSSGARANVSSNALSKEMAEREALNDCQSKGGLNCKIEVAYDNECAAVVVGDQGYVVTSNPFEDEAIKAGTGTCGG